MKTSTAAARLLVKRALEYYLGNYTQLSDHEIVSRVVKEYPDLTRAEVWAVVREMEREGAHAQGD